MKNKSIQVFRAFSAGVCPALILSVLIEATIPLAAAYERFSGGFRPSSVESRACGLYTPFGSRIKKMIDVKELPADGVRLNGQTVEFFIRYDSMDAEYLYPESSGLLGVMAIYFLRIPGPGTDWPSNCGRDVGFLVRIARSAFKKDGTFEYKIEAKGGDTDLPTGNADKCQELTFPIREMAHPFISLSIADRCKKKTVHEEAYETRFYRYPAIRRTLWYLDAKAKFTLPPELRRL